MLGSLCTIKINDIFFVVLLFGYEVGIWMIVAIVTFPFQFMRQIICILQLSYACKEIAAFDLKQRLTRKQ